MPWTPRIRERRYHARHAEIHRPPHPRLPVQPAAGDPARAEGPARRGPSSTSSTSPGRATGAAAGADAAARRRCRCSSSPTAASSRRAWSSCSTSRTSSPSGRSRSRTRSAAPWRTCSRAWRATSSRRATRFVMNQDPARRDALREKMLAQYARLDDFLAEHSPRRHVPVRGVRLGRGRVHADVHALLVPRVLRGLRPAAGRRVRARAQVARRLPGASLRAAGDAARRS